MRNWIPALVFGAITGVAAPAAGQAPLPLGFEVRLDAGIPVEGSRDTFDAGVGFGARVSLDLAPTFAVYGGYSQFTFDYEDDVLADTELETGGFEVGGRVQLGGGGAITSAPYFVLGALFHDDDTGIEAGLGVDYPVSWNLSVTPAVRYRRVDDLTYVTIGMGARFHF